MDETTEGQDNDMQSTGQYVENVVKICKEKHSWNDVRIDKAVKDALDEGLIIEKTYSGKPLLRIVDDENANVYITDPFHDMDTQTEINGEYV